MLCWLCSFNAVILCAIYARFNVCTNKIHTYVLKKLKKKSNYEGFGECTDEPCGVRYLQKGWEPLI